MSKIIKEKRVFIKNSQDPESRKLLSEKLYDHSENLISDTNFFPQGGIESKRTLEYDDRKNVIQETNFGEGNYSTISKYQYDDNDIMVKKTLVYSDGSEEHELIKTTEDVISIEAIDEEGNTTLLEERILDEQKNIIEQKYFLERETERIDQFFYDENGNMIQIRIYVPSENAEFVIDQKFNDEGQLTEKIQLDEQDEILVRVQNTYEGENLIKEILEDYTQGDKRTVTHFLFNEDGLKTTERIEDFEGNVLLQNNYEYNVHKHLISVTSEIPTEDGLEESAQKSKQSTHFELIYFED